MREILIATGNPDKAREMQQILGDSGDGSVLPIRWRALAEFGEMPEAVENGTTFQANADQKAHHYARLTGLWTIADDSGLEVDALDGAPGVWSARYAGPQATYADNNARLMNDLAGVSAERRQARYRCVAVLSDGQRILARSEGTVQGRILEEPRGQGGFGYDPYFFVAEYQKTMAELTADQKHAISHRGRALRALRTRLITLVGEHPR